MAHTEKWWAVTCTACGGFVPVRVVDENERELPQLRGQASCVRCYTVNVLSSVMPFVIDGKRLRRIRLSSPIDYVA